ncbi:MAG: divergent polysaccharide deacetylase family protein [Acidobacteriota bacterium]
MPRQPAPRRGSVHSSGGRSRRPRSRLSGFFLFLLGVLVGGIALYLGFSERPGPSSPVREEKPAETPGASKASPPAPRPRSKPAAPDHVEPDRTGASEVAVVSAPASAQGGRIALVIDDLGRSVADLDTIGNLDVPVSYAVLPYEEETGAVVEELHRRKAEVLLHLPMEPANGEDPGPNALRLGMTPEQLRQLTLAALRAVPGAVGVNNHMGSGLSADERSMKTILLVLAGRRLFFLDSRTSAQSVGYQTAIRAGVPAAERQVFLDSDTQPEAIRAQFNRLLGLARTRGAAVAIGHPHPETLAILAEEVPKAKALGYEFVPVSYLLDRPDSQEAADSSDE